MNLSDLKKPFPADDIEWRVQRSGEKNNKIWAMVLAYVTNRAIMERLDDVVKPENWKNEFREGPGGGVICGISIKCSDEWVTKWDGAENTNFEAIKGGLSGAMKRAAVQWGIGRYLYNLEATFANVTDAGKYSDKTKEGKWYKWNPPELPAWALPDWEKPSEKEPPKSIVEPTEFDTLCERKDIVGPEKEDFVTYLRETRKASRKMVLENFGTLYKDFRTWTTEQGLV